MDKLPRLFLKTRDVDRVRTPLISLRGGCARVSTPSRPEQRTNTLLHGPPAGAELYLDALQPEIRSGQSAQPTCTSTFERSVMTALEKMSRRLDDRSARVEEPSNRVMTVLPNIPPRLSLWLRRSLISRLSPLRMRNFHIWPLAGNKANPDEYEKKLNRHSGGGDPGLLPASGMGKQSWEQDIATASTSIREYC